MSDRKHKFDKLQKNQDNFVKELEDELVVIRRKDGKDERDQGIARDWLERATVSRGKNAKDIQEIKQLLTDLRGPAPKKPPNSSTSSASVPLASTFPPVAAPSTTNPRAPATPPTPTDQQIRDKMLYTVPKWSCKRISDTSYVNREYVRLFRGGEVPSEDTRKLLIVWFYKY